MCECADVPCKPFSFVLGGFVKRCPVTCNSSWPRVTLSLLEMICHFSLGTVWAGPRAHVCGPGNPSQVPGSRGPQWAAAQVPSPSPFHLEMGSCQVCRSHMWRDMSFSWGARRSPNVCQATATPQETECVTLAFQEGAV